MTTQRLVRINQLLQQEVAEQLYRIVNDENFDMSAVTVTHVVTTSDLRHARVFVSIRGDDETQKKMLRQLISHRHEVQAAIAKDVVMKYTPQVSFELDKSIAKGDHVLKLISDLEAEHPDWPTKPPEPESPEEHDESEI